MSLQEGLLVALPCKFELGGFSGERVFDVVLANGQHYQSVAPRFFFWNDHGKLVNEDEPQTESTGMIAARVVDQTDDGQFLVVVPDGEVIAVEKAAVKNRPTVIRPPESKPHVPVRS